MKAFGSTITIEQYNTLVNKYNILRKGIEELVTEHTNSTAGLDSDDMHERLINLLKNDNKHSLEKVE